MTAKIGAVPFAGGTAQAELGSPAAGGEPALRAGTPAAGGIGGPAPQTTRQIGGPASHPPRSISTKKKDGRVAGFAPALLDPAAAVPEGLVDAAGRAAGTRFDVYRNNVVVSLSEALATGFPVVRKLVGEAFFSAMAGVFVRAHPPRSPVLTMYGEGFPAFLETFPPVAHLPYLADTARLEYALRLAYHAADATAIPREALQDPRLIDARLTLAPATRLVVSPHPVHAIWRANTEPGAPPARGGAEAVLVTRPDWDPKPVVVPAPAARFLAALLDGQTFGQALDAAGAALDLAATLTLLIDTRSITHLEVPA